MTSAMRHLHKRLPGKERYPLPPREITDEVLDPPAAVAPDLTLAAHFAYGAACGALLAAANPRIGPGRRRARRRRHLAGALYGLAPGLRRAEAGHPPPAPARRGDVRRPSRLGLDRPPRRCASWPRPAPPSSPPARTRTPHDDRDPLIALAASARRARRPAGRLGGDDRHSAGARLLRAHGTGTDSAPITIFRRGRLIALERGRGAGRRLSRGRRAAREPAPLDDRKRERRTR